jgi:hypothetical protein
LLLTEIILELFNQPKQVVLEYFEKLLRLPIEDLLDILFVDLFVFLNTFAD